jgi:ferredoxin like protein
MTTIDDKLALVRFKVDEESHLVILSKENCLLCERKQCTIVCPAEVYIWEENTITVNYEGCLECGSCRIVCNEFNNIEWQYPRGGYGVQYAYG